MTDKIQKSKVFTFSTEDIVSLLNERMEDKLYEDNDIFEGLGDNADLDDFSISEDSLQYNASTGELTFRVDATIHDWGKPEGADVGSLTHCYACGRAY